MTEQQQTAICNLQSLGFTWRQAEFLYLVGTQTGVFTAAHFRIFTGTDMGGTSVALVAKLDERGFIKRKKYGPSEWLHVTHKAFYQAILTPDSRLRRPMSLPLLRQRLQYLDVLVRRTEPQYFGSEAEKVEFFCDTLRVPESLLPQTLYRSKTSGKESLRFFTDRYPVFQTQGTEPSAGIVYGEDPKGKFESFRKFLQANSKFFDALGKVHLVYVSPSHRRAALAKDAISALSGGLPEGEKLDLRRYFDMRKRIERNEGASFQKEDYEFWKRARVQFAGDRFELLYLQDKGFSNRLCAGAPHAGHVTLEHFQPFSPNSPAPTN